jgi:trimethylamine--corrinoid protein Co-methyltransferase
MYQRCLLNDAAVEPLAESTLTILEKVGVICQDRELLEALERWGAWVDCEAERARFPRRLVEEFVERIRQEALPRPAALPFRAPPRPTLGTLVAPFYYDDEGGVRRPGTRDDLITLIKLGDTVHPQEGTGHALLLRECDPLVEPLEAALVLAEYSHKPGPAFAWDERQVDYLLEMGAILERNNWFTMGSICFAHPLRFDREVARRLVRMARLGMPIGLTGMQVAGATTPVTTAGFIAVSAAEFVATWIAGRAVNSSVRLASTMWAGNVDLETAPLGGTIYGGSVDMKSGEVSYSAPDAMLRAFALSEFLGRWCGQPIPVGGGEYAAARVPGLYTALEKAYKAMTIAAFTGHHPQVGVGMVDDGKTVSPVQFLLDTEMTIALESLAAPVEVSPEAIALDAILEVGHGLEKNHLLTEHTLRHYRRSLWCPALLEHAGWNGLATEEAVLERARRRVRELIASYRKPEADPDKLAALQQVVERARQRLLG